jgi:hypothetical protein
MKKKIIVSGIIVILIFVVGVGWYLHQRSKIIPELLGDWTHDIKASKNFERNKHLDNEMLNSYIQEWSKAKTKIEFKLNGTMIVQSYGGVYYYTYRPIKRQDSLIEIEMKEFKEDGTKPLFNDGEAFPRRLIIISPTQFAIDGNDRWPVYTKVD